MAVYVPLCPNEAVRDAQTLLSESLKVYAIVEHLGWSYQNLAISIKIPFSYLVIIRRHTAQESK
jgi:hypothetical protein